MSGDLSLFVTAVASPGPHIKFYAQLNTEKFAALDGMIDSLQSYFEQMALSAPLDLQPGEMVLAKCVTAGAVRWHRARVLCPLNAERGTVSVEYVDYGTSDVAHLSQICAGRGAATGAILSQPPLAVPCVLAEVAPALGAWSDAAVGYVESKLRFKRVQGQLLRQDADGVLHVRVFTADNSTLASQLVALGLGRLAAPHQLAAAAAAPAVGVAAAGRPAAPLPQLAARVKDMTSVPPPAGAELLVTICHWSHGPAKFAIHLHSQQAALQQLMAEIQAYCHTSPPVPLQAVESGAVCLGASSTHDDRYLRGVITQADGSVVKVYWVDYGNDETKLASELRAMPLQFAQLRIQATRVALAGVAGLTPVQGQQHVFRQVTEGSVLTCRFSKTREQPPQVELFDMGTSVLDLLLRLGAYERRGGSCSTTGAAPAPAAAQETALSPLLRGPSLTPASHAEVLVVSVTAVNSLCVRPLETEPALRRLTAQLTDALNVHACPLAPEQAVEGAMCAVFKDAGYQRARIVSVGRRDMKVLHVDLGTSEIVPTAAAFVLEPRLAAYPPQAVPCCLAGLEMSHGTPKLVEELRALTAGGRLLCEVQDQLGDKRIVRLTDLTRAPPLDVGAALRERMGRRVPPPASPVSPAAAPPAVAVRPPQLEPGRSVTVTVTYAESAALFFGQLVRPDEAKFADAMEKAMQLAYGGGRATPLPVAAAAAGCFCAAASAIDGTFYRARVLSAKGDKVTVQYIDYGDTETKSASEVHPLKAEFALLSQLGVFCSLVGAEAVPAAMFVQMVQDQTIEVLPSSGQGDRYKVILPPCAANQPLLAQLKRFGVGSAPVAGAGDPEPATNGASPRTSGTAPAGDPPTLASPQKLPVGVFKDVEVVHVVAPSEFYVRLRESAAALRTLQEELASYEAAPAAAFAAADQPVAVRGGDGRWSRGRVLASRDDQVTVFLVDAGETVTVPVSAVRHLRPEHARLPAQAVRCWAKGARPAAAAGWSDDEVAKFRRDALERGFLARADELRGGTCVVTLAQAEPVTPGVPRPRAADANNNTTNTKKVSPPRADQDMNWRDRSAPPPPAPAAAESANWRTAEPRPAGGGPRAERRPSTSGRPAAAPAEPRAPSPGPEPELDRFAGKMRMDRPEEYERRPRDAWGGGDAPDVARPTAERRRPRPPPDDDWGDGGDDKAPPPTTTPAAAVEIPPHAARIEKRALPGGTTVRAAPTWVRGLHRFHVQPPTDAEFGALMAEMQTLYGALRPTEGLETDPAPGKPVAARFTDGAWYRAEVRAVSGDQLRVLFLDYGNAETVPRGEVKRLKEEHCRLPAQAYCCRFGGVEPAGGTWKALDETQLAKYFSCDMEVTSLSSAGVVTEVEVTLSGRKVTDLLVADGLAVRPPPAQLLRQENLGPFPGLNARFRPGQRLAVFVSYIVGPDRLYGQLASCAAELEQLEARVEPAAAAGEAVDSVAVGRACLAPFEGSFYRGVVVDGGGELPSVYFVDYGNTERLAAAELLQCPEELAVLPAQALRLSLTGVPADRADDLLARADQTEFSARVDRVADSWLEVTLLDGDVNVNLELGGGVPAEPVPAAAARPAERAARQTADQTEDHAADQTADQASERGAAPAAPAGRSVFVSFVVSPAEFYAQEAAAADQLDTLMAQLEAEYAQLGDGERTVAEVQPGDLVAAVYSEDGAFYRARVLAASDDGRSLHLQFVDYGNCEWSPAAGCRQLTPPLLAPAPFAQRCRLAARPAGAEWTPAAGDALEALTGAPDGRVTLLAAEEDGAVWTVRLETEDGRDVAAALAEAGHALADRDEPPVPAPAGPAPDQGPEPAAAGLGSLTPGRPATAAVVFSLGPTEFWAQLLADSERLDAVMAALEAARPLPAAANVAAGVLVAVRYVKDGALYRARVLGDAGDDARRVLLVDYGNTETVPAAELRACPPAAAAEPPLALRCALALRPAAWSDAALARFAELAAEELELTLLAAGEPALVALRHGGRDLAEAMIEAGLAEPLEAEAEPTAAAASAGDDVHTNPGRDAETDGDRPGETEPASDALREAEPALAETQPAVTADAQREVEPAPTKTDGDRSGETEAASDTQRKAKPAESAVAGGSDADPCRDLPTREPAAAPLDVAGEHEVFVSHVNSPLDFYAQSVDTAALDAMMEQLAAEEPADGDDSPPAEPEPGLLYSAPFSGDSTRYRARVLAVSAGAARVLFVDYGNDAEVAVRELRPLSTALSAPPAQALRCRLAVEACAPEATGRLCQLTEEGALLTVLARGADADGPWVRVRLTVGGEDVAASLAADGLCRPARRPALPPALPPPLDDEVPVEVTHVEDDGVVYMLVGSDAAARRELYATLDELYAAPPPALAEPAAGELCVLRRPDGAGWSRAVLLAVDTAAGRARLRLADSGAPVEAPLAELLEPLPAAALPPPLATRCRLAAPAPHAPALRQLLAGSGGRLTARLSAGAAGPVAELALDGRPVRGLPSPPAADVTPSPRSTGRRNRDDKIVPGQISFSLIAAPDETGQEPQPEAPVPAGQPETAETTPGVSGGADPADGRPPARGRHLSHEDKIAPGQISHSLLTCPPPDEAEPPEMEGGTSETTGWYSEEAPTKENEEVEDTDQTEGLVETEDAVPSCVQEDIGVVTMEFAGLEITDVTELVNEEESTEDGIEPGAELAAVVTEDDVGEGSGRLEIKDQTEQRARLEAIEEACEPGAVVEDAGAEVETGVGELTGSNTTMVALGNGNGRTRGVSEVDKIGMVPLEDDCEVEKVGTAGVHSPGPGAIESGEKEETNIDIREVKTELETREDEFESSGKETEQEVEECEFGSASEVGMKQESNEDDAAELEALESKMAGLVLKEEAPETGMSTTENINLTGLGSVSSPDVFPEDLASTCEIEDARRPHGPTHEAPPADAEERLGPGSVGGACRENYSDHSYEEAGTEETCVSEEERYPREEIVAESCSSDDDRPFELELSGDALSAGEFRPLKEDIGDEPCAEFAQPVFDVEEGDGTGPSLATLALEEEASVERRSDSERHFELDVPGEARALDLAPAVGDEAADDVGSNDEDKAAAEEASVSSAIRGKEGHLEGSAMGGEELPKIDCDYECTNADCRHQEGKLAEASNEKDREADQEADSVADVVHSDDFVIEEPVGEMYAGMGDAGSEDTWAADDERPHAAAETPARLGGPAGTGDGAQEPGAGRHPKETGAAPSPDAARSEDGAPTLAAAGEPAEQ